MDIFSCMLFCLHCSAHGADTIADVQVLQDALPDGATSDPAPAAVLFCERFIEFLVDLLSQAPTRRFVRTLLEDRAILAKCRLAPLLLHPKGVILIRSSVAYSVEYVTLSYSLLPASTACARCLRTEQS